MKKVRRTKENVIMKPRGLTRTVKFCLAPGALSDAIHELCKEARQVRNQLILIPNSFDEKISELRKNEEANKCEIELYSSLLPCVRSPGAIRALFQTSSPEKALKASITRELTKAKKEAEQQQRRELGLDIAPETTQKKQQKTGKSKRAAAGNATRDFKKGLFYEYSNKDKAEILRKHLADNDFFTSLMASGSRLQMALVYNVAKQLLTDRDSHFERLKEGKKSNLPSVKRLDSVYSKGFCVSLDADLWSFTSEGLRVNIYGKGVDSVLISEMTSGKILQATSGVFVSAIRLGCSHGRAYVEVIYDAKGELASTANAKMSQKQAEEQAVRKSAKSKSKESQRPKTPAKAKTPETKSPETKSPETKSPETKEPETKEPETKEPEKTAPKARKSAGGDPGFTNIVTFFVNDEETPCISICGRALLATNVEFNVKLAEAQAKKDALRNAERAFFVAAKERWQRHPTWKDLLMIPGYKEAQDRLIAAETYLGTLFSQRNCYMTDFAHKTAKKIVDYLEASGVTDIGLPVNLGDWFQEPSRWSRFQNAKFRKIPVMRILNYIHYLAEERGIAVVWIDESYTSKTSAISNNIIQIHEESKKKEIQFTASRDVLLGVRRDRTFTDDNHGILHADAAAAANICTLATGTATVWTKRKIDKLRSPIVLRGTKLRNFFSLTSAAFSGLNPESRAPIAMGHLCL